MSLTMLGVLLGSIVCAIGGQVAFKSGMNRRDGRALGFAARMRPTLPLLACGLGLYALSMLFWLKTLSRVELSVAFPFLSLNFIGILLAARFHLREALGPSRLLGAAMVLAGVVLVYLSA